MTREDVLQAVDRGWKSIATNKMDEGVAESITDEVLKTLDTIVEPENMLFDRIWDAINGWDLERKQGDGYAGATGDDVRTIIKALFGEQEMNNGVSKKVCVISSCISGVLGLAANAPDKLPYAIIVGIMFVAFLVSQVFLDWSNNGKTKES